jgi:hypothetical protein
MRNAMIPSASAFQHSPDAGTNNATLGCLWLVFGLDLYDVAQLKHTSSLTVSDYRPPHFGRLGHAKSK